MAALALLGMHLSFRQQHARTQLPWCLAVVGSKVKLPPFVKCVVFLRALLEAAAQRGIGDDMLWFGCRAPTKPPKNWLLAHTRPCRVMSRPTRDGGQASCSCRCPPSLHFCRLCALMLLLDNFLPPFPRDSLAVLIVSPSLFLRRKKNELISNKLFFS